MNRQVRVGVAKEVITPPPGVELWGYARTGNYEASGLYDNLYVRVLVLESSTMDVSLGLITLDLGGISGDWADQVRSIIERETRISGKHVIFSVSHTHAGPAPFSTRGLGHPNKQYLKNLKKTIVKAFMQASKNQIPVTGGAESSCVDLSVNRLEKSLEDSENSDPGKVDPYVRVFRFDKQSGEPYALIVNYTAHPNTLRRDNRNFSADYPGVMIKALERHLEAQVFFLQGAAGNVDPKLRGDYQATKKLGTALAEQVLQTNAHIQTYPLSRAWIIHEPVWILWQSPPSIEQIREKLKEDQERLKIGGKDQRRFGIPNWREHRIEWRKSLLKRLETTGSLPPLRVPLHIFSLNGTCWVTLPGEPFVELGQMIQADSPGEPTFILGYANDTRMGYIPTKSAYSEGGYEIEVAFQYYGFDLPVRKGTGEMLVAKMKRIKTSIPFQTK